MIINKIKIPVVIHLQGILTVYETKWFAADINKLDLVRNSSLKSFLLANSMIHNYRSFQKAAKEREIFSICKYFMGRTDWDRRISAVLSPDAEYFTSNEMLRSIFYMNIWDKKFTENKLFISTIQPNIYKRLGNNINNSISFKKIKSIPFFLDSCQVYPLTTE